MKKSIGLIALMMVAIAFVVVPATAVATAVGCGEATTGVTVCCCGHDPIIKCKWEQDNSASMEDGDPEHVKYEDCERNSWFAPECGGPTTVYIFAVVTDADGISDISEVTYSVTGPCGEFYKEGCMGEWGDFSNVVAAEDAKLIYWASNFDLADAEFELDTSCPTAKIYSAEIEIGYCDPAGSYTVEINALDLGGLKACPLVNKFVMTRLACCDCDFTEINWNTIKQGGHQVVPGDEDMSTPDRPTVENKGNVDVWVKVTEDPLTDAAGVEWTTSLCGCPYYIYDAQILNQDSPVYFYPNEPITLNGYIERCEMDGLCFSLEILNPMPAGDYTGKVYIECVDAGEDPCAIPCVY